MIRSWDEIDGDLKLSCDVVIVGSGAGGAPAAALLAEAGWKVIVLEEGGYHPTESFTPNAEGANRRLYRDAGAGILLGDPPIRLLSGRTLGGSTALGYGTAVRPRPGKLAEWRERYGLTELTDAHLEPFFGQAEKDLGVSRADRRRISPADRLIQTGAKKAGWTVEPLQRAAVGCRGCGVCAMGCPTGAQQSTLVSYLPRALKAGAEIYCDAQVRKIKFRKGKAVGVSGAVLKRYARKTVRRFEVSAPWVIVSAGALGSPSLLQRSLGSESRPAPATLGANLRIHPTATLLALFDKPILGWEGIPQGLALAPTGRTDLWAAGGSLHPAQAALIAPGFGHDHKAVMARFASMAQFTVMVEDRSEGEVRALNEFDVEGRYRLGHEDADALKYGLKSLAEAFFEAGAVETIPGAIGAVTGIAKDRANALESIVRLSSGSLLLSGLHPMGTCAMGASAETSAVDVHGKVWGREAVYASDASIFPSALGVPPMLTVTALALRLANHLINQSEGGRP